MIRTPTVLVVGAGASKPYGLPTGDELLQQARSIDSAAPFYEPLTEALGGRQALMDVVSELRPIPAPTLDEVLEARPHLDKPIRIIIAALLHRAIHGSREASPDDWLGEVMEQMRLQTGANPENFHLANPGLTIVTFNFDSIIEDRLKHTIGSLWSLPEETAAAVADKVRVLHVHGRLPQDGSHLDKHSLERAAATVRLSRDGPDQVDREVLSSAVAALKAARVVCFLGFGFAWSNITRLEIPSSLSRNGARPHVYATAKHVPPGHRERIDRWLGGGVVFADRNEGCRDAIRNLFVFRE